MKAVEESRFAAKHFRPSSSGVKRVHLTLNSGVHGASEKLRFNGPDIKIPEFRRKAYV